MHAERAPMHKFARRVEMISAPRRTVKGFIGVSGRASALPRFFIVLSPRCVLQILVLVSVLGSQSVVFSRSPPAIALLPVISLSRLHLFVFLPSLSEKQFQSREVWK